MHISSDVALLNTVSTRRIERETAPTEVWDDTVGKPGDEPVNEIGAIVVEEVPSHAPMVYTSPSMTNQVQTQVLRTEEDDMAEGLAKSAKEEFLDFANMSPAEKYRAMFLAEMGLTEEDLAKMPQKERREIEDLLRERIKAKLKEDSEKQTGMPIGVDLQMMDEVAVAFLPSSIDQLT